MFFFMSPQQLFIQYLFLFIVLLKFMEQNGRRMLVKSRDEDITLLDNLRNSMLEQMKVNDSVVSKEFSR